MAAVIATGVPNPAAPSMKAPNEKAMSKPGDPRFCPRNHGVRFRRQRRFPEDRGCRGHIRTKIVTPKDRLDVGQAVQPTHLAESK